MNKNIINSLENLEEQYESLSKKLNDDKITSDFNKYNEINKKYKSIEEVVLKFKEYKNCLKSIDSSKELLQDKEMRELANEEIKINEAKISQLEKDIKLLLIPKSEFDDKNIIMEIRGAVGGDEANIFAGDLYEMYNKYFEKKKWKVNLINSTETEAGGLSNVSFEVDGKNVYSFMKFESGSHRVQRVPKTESLGRVHTSVATVAVLPKPDKVESVVNLNDLRIDTYRASGAGGQHVNKTDSAIRITHVPTGIIVQSQDGRSQHDNKAKAMEILAAKIYELELDKQKQKESNLRKDAVGKGERSEKIRTYNYPQNRVTDHRISLTLNKLDQVMEGNIDEIVNALIADEQQRKLDENN